MDGVVLTVRLNEFAMRGQNPHVPWSPEELAATAAACVEAGASIVHFHGRNPDTGAPDPDAAVLSETVKRINAACDAVTFCTLGAGMNSDRETRLRSLTGAANKPDLAPVDLGSFNLDLYDGEARSFVVDEGLYVNTVGTVRYLTEGIVAAGVKPAAVAWSVGSMRLLTALLAQGVWPEPVYAELVVSDRLLSVHPATAEGVETLLRFRPETTPIVWTVECAMGSVLPLVDDVIALGGGFAFGLGDHPYTELGTPSNAEVVAAVAARVRSAGRRPATPDEVRAALGL